MLSCLGILFPHIHIHLRTHMWTGLFYGLSKPVPPSLHDFFFHGSKCICVPFHWPPKNTYRNEIFHISLLPVVFPNSSVFAAPNARTTEEQTFLSIFLLIHNSLSSGFYWPCRARSFDTSGENPSNFSGFWIRPILARHKGAIHAENKRRESLLELFKNHTRTCLRACLINFADVFPRGIYFPD